MEEIAILPVLPYLSVAIYGCHCQWGDCGIAVQSSTIWKDHVCTRLLTTEHNTAT